MKQRLFFLISIGALWIPGLFGQNASFMDHLLAAKAITGAQASYLVLTAIGAMADTESVEDCLTKAQTLGWVNKQTSNSKAILLADYSYLLMQAFKIKSGLLYALFPGPHYAFREMDFRAIIKNVGPDQSIAGAEALRILSQVMELKK